MSKKYPTDKDVQTHKDGLWTAILQHFSGLVPMEHVETALRSLMGDGVLWVHNNHKGLDMEAVKKKLMSLRLTENG